MGSLDNLSTTTNMIVAPLETGRPVMKSIDKSSYTWSGMGKGYSKPTSFEVGDLICWQT